MKEVSSVAEKEKGNFEEGHVFPQLLEELLPPHGKFLETSS